MFGLNLIANIETGLCVTCPFLSSFSYYMSDIRQHDRQIDKKGKAHHEKQTDNLIERQDRRRVQEIRLQFTLLCLWHI